MIHGSLEPDGKGSFSVIFDNHFKTQAHIMASVELVRDDGTLIAVKQIPAESMNAASVRTTPLPAGIVLTAQNGYFVVRVTTVGLDVTGQSADHIEEMYIHIDEGDIEVLDADDYFARSQAYMEVTVR